MARRTVRKLTVWSDDEWRSVEDAARPSGVPPLRFVREAALEKARKGGGAPPRRGRRTDELVHQLTRVLINLRQLQSVAEGDWDDDGARLVAAVITAAEAATAAPPERGRDAAAVLEHVHAAGVALNELAGRANSAEYLPPDAPDVLTDVFVAVSRCVS